MKVHRWLLTLCSFCLLLMALATLFYLFKNVSILPVVKFISIPIVCGILILFSMLFVRILQKGENLFLLFLMGTTMISCFFWNLFAKTVPISDYSVLLDGARNLSQGMLHEAFEKSSYFSIYNYQIGYASYLAMLMKLLGQNLFWFKFIEALLLSLTSVVIYKIASHYIHPQSGAIASGFFSTFAFNIMGSSILNNQHLSGFLLIFGVYFFLKNKPRYTILAGALWGIMNVVRPMGIVLLFSALLYIFYLILNKSSWKKSFATIALLFFAFYTTVMGFDMLLMNLKITPTPISKNNLPYFKFVIGLGAKDGSLFGNRTQDARKTNVYFDLETLNFDYNAYNKACLRFITDRISDYPRTLKFLGNKMAFFLGEKDHQYTFALNAEKQQNFKMKVLPELAHAQYFIMVLFAFLSTVFFRKQLTSKMSFFPILLIVFLFVHLFVEAQTRYRYDIYIFLMILASISMNRLLALLKHEQIQTFISKMHHKECFL